MAVDTVEIDELEGVVTLFTETPFGMMTTSAQFWYCSCSPQPISLLAQPYVIRGDLPPPLQDAMLTRDTSR